MIATAGRVLLSRMAVERIGKVIGRPSPEELAEVAEGLNEIIGI